VSALLVIVDCQFGVHENLVFQLVFPGSVSTHRINMGVFAHRITRDDWVCHRCQSRHDITARDLGDGASSDVKLAGEPVDELRSSRLVHVGDNNFFDGTYRRNSL
jgi:hypothetical protein